jgi:hypothetical protein
VHAQALVLDICLWIHSRANALAVSLANPVACNHSISLWLHPCYQTTKRSFGKAEQKHIYLNNFVFACSCGIAAEMQGAPTCCVQPIEKASIGVFDEAVGISRYLHPADKCLSEETLPAAQAMALCKRSSSAGHAHCICYSLQRCTAAAFAGLSTRVARCMHYLAYRHHSMNRYSR